MLRSKNEEIDSLILNNPTIDSNNDILIELQDGDNDSENDNNESIYN